MAASVLALAVTVVPCRASSWLRVEGLGDAEGWDTDAAYSSISRRDGVPAAEGQLRLWAAAEALPGLHVFVLGAISSDSEEYGRENEAGVEQAFVRYTAPTRGYLSIEAGKVVTPIGAFPRRYFADENPLVGEPLGYAIGDPLALQVSGGVARFDYALGVMDHPLAVNTRGVDAGSAYRPTLALGVTPTTGLRLGAYGTRGPYLGPEAIPYLPGEEGWRDSDQTAVGAEVRFSRGYFELNGEWLRTASEVPGADEAARGKSYYADVKYTWTPRVFTAVRLGQYDQPQILPPGAPGEWVVRRARSFDAEGGVGYRFTPGVLLKASYRQQWRDARTSAAQPPDPGYALAIQLAYRFDVTSWLDAAR
jgi:hypothetical protein